MIQYTSIQFYLLHYPEPEMQKLSWWNRGQTRGNWNDKYHEK